MENYTDLSHKTVLITGGGSGAGKEIVKEFSKTGARIAFTYNSSDESAKKLIAELDGTDVKAYRFNQADVDEAKALLEKVKEDFGSLDVLVNNAGIYPAKPVREIDERDWDEMLDTNTKGVFFLSKAAAEMMEKENGGSIINISSINADNPAMNLVHYGVSKAAVEMETKCLAYGFGPKVRVNCVAPGLIWKEGQEQFIPGWRESYSERSALKRLVYASEIGKACIFFASDLSSAVTGQILTVDCGVMLAPCFDNSLR